MFKKLNVLLLTSFLSVPGFAQELVNYDQVKQAVAQGEEVRIVADVTKCTEVNDRQAAFLKSKSKLKYATDYKPELVTLKTNTAVVLAHHIEFIHMVPMQDGRFIEGYFVDDAGSVDLGAMGVGHFACPSNAVRFFS